MKKTAILLSLLICASALTACGNEDRGDGTGHMFDVPLLQNPESLDPQYADDPSSNTVIRNLYSGLMKIAPDGSVELCNAASYKVSEDGMVYTFNLRDDNFWFYDGNHDDVITEDEYFPVTAQDYEFALRRVLDPKMKSPYAEDFSCIMGAKEVMLGLEPVSFAEIYAPDESTLQIVLNAPNAEFLTLMASPGAYPCNEEFFDSTKGRYGLDDRSVMSNGAFFVRQWFFDPYGSNNILYMKRNDANWSEVYDIYPSFLSFTIEWSEEDIREVFKKDEIECFTTMDSSLYNPDKYVIEGIPATTMGLIFNPKDKLWSNDGLRRSLALATDRGLLAEAENSDITAAWGIIPPAVKVCGRSYRELASDRGFIAFDRDEALSTYNSAKKELGVENTGDVKILVNAEETDSSALHIITRSWQDIFGSYIGIEDVSADEFEKRISEGDYSIALYPLRGRRALGSAVFREIESNPATKGAVPEGGFMAELTGCSTVNDLVAAYSAAEKQAAESCWFIPLFYKNSYLIANKDNEQIMYDPFSGAVDYRLALNYD